MAATAVTNETRIGAKMSVVGASKLAAGVAAVIAGEVLLSARGASVAGSLGAGIVAGIPFVTLARAASSCAGPVAIVTAVVDGCRLSCVEVLGMTGEGDDTEA